jgi:hypothetical protein
MLVLSGGITLASYCQRLIEENAPSPPRSLWSLVVVTSLKLLLFSDAFLAVFLLIFYRM